MWILYQNCLWFDLSTYYYIITRAMTDILNVAYGAAVNDINQFIEGSGKSSWHFLRETDNFLGSATSKFLSKRLISEVDKCGLSERYKARGSNLFKKKGIESAVSELVFSSSSRLIQLNRLGDLTISDVDNDIKPIIDRIVLELTGDNK
jgi:hypothetical protein